MNDVTVTLTENEALALMYSSEFQSLYTDNREEADFESAKDKIHAAMTRALSPAERAALRPLTFPRPVMR